MIKIVVRNLWFVIEFRFAWWHDKGIWKGLFVGKEEERLDTLKMCISARIKFIDMMEETKR